MYAKLDAMLQGRCHESRQLPGQATYLKRLSDGKIAVRYHDTNVLTFSPSGVVYESGGWRTATTKARLNEYGPLNLYARGGVWLFNQNGYTFRYCDGMTVGDNGNVIGAVEDAREYRVADRKLKKRVKEYAERCVAEMPLPEPSGGDCFYCTMRTVDGGVPLGDAFRNTDHLESHFDEGYVVPSLVRNALEAQHAGPAYYHAAFGADGFGMLQNGGNKTLTRIIYRYVLKRFGYCV